MAAAFDVGTPSPDAGHEAIRVAVVKAIADLGDTASGVDDSFLLVDTLFDLIDSAMTDRQALADRVTTLEGALAALQAAVEALTPPPVDPAPVDPVP